MDYNSKIINIDNKTTLNIKLYKYDINNDFPTLHNNEIHLWVINKNALVINNLIPLLSNSEIEKMKKYHFKKDADTFATARGNLRMLIGKYINLSPLDICFDLGKYGKPRITDNQNSKGLLFNLSHSGDMVVIAFSLNFEIGVDVEKVKTISDSNALINNYFHSTEKEYLLKYNENLDEMFIDLWTTKEAFIKGTGEGLNRRLNSFYIKNDELNNNVYNVIEDNEFKGWKLIKFTPYLGYKSSLAFKYFR